MPGGKGRMSKRISTHQPRAQYHQRSKSYGSKPMHGHRTPKRSRGFIESLINPPKGGKRKRW